MNLYKVPECTIHNIFPFPANNFGYIPDCIHIRLDKICPNIFQKQLIVPMDMVPDSRPWNRQRRKLLINAAVSCYDDCLMVLPCDITLQCQCRNSNSATENRDAHVDRDWHYISDKMDIFKKVNGIDWINVNWWILVKVNPSWPKLWMLTQIGECWPKLVKVAWIWRMLTQIDQLAQIDSLWLKLIKVDPYLISLIRCQ